MSSDTYCKSCGSHRLDDKGDICLNCGARQDKRISVRTLIVLAIASLIIGAAYLWMSVSYSQPKTKIIDLDEDYDNRYVVLEGKIIDVNFNKEEYESFGRFGFDLYDGTGVVYITMDNDVSKTLFERGDVPYIGSYVQVGGKFYGERGTYEELYGRKVYRPDGVVVVNSAERVKFLDVEYKGCNPLEFANSNITSYQPGDAIHINGTVSDIMNASSGIVLRLRCADVMFTALIPKYVIDLGMMGYEDVFIGDIVEIYGGLEWYYSYWEVIPHKLNVIGSIGYEKHSVNTLLANTHLYFDHAVNVTGIVESIYWDEEDNIKYTYMFYIRDLSEIHSGQTLCVYIKDANKNIYFGDLDIGDVVEVCGLFTNYTKKSGSEVWEIVIRPYSHDYIKVIGNLSFGGESYIATTVSAIMESAEEYNNTLVNVSGIVDDIYWDTDLYGNMYTRKFYIRDMEDQDSKILVYIDDWDKVIYSLYVGSVVRVYGIINKYYFGEGYYWEILIRDGSGDRVDIVKLEPEEEYVWVNVSMLISDPESYNNTLVQIHDAIVVYIYWDQTGGLNYTKRIKIRDNNSAYNETLTVYIGDETKYLYNISVGCHINVYGKFQLYINKEGERIWEVYIRHSSLDHIELLGANEY